MPVVLGFDVYLLVVSDVLGRAVVVSGPIVVSMEDAAVSIVVRSSSLAAG